MFEIELKTPEYDTDKRNYAKNPSGLSMHHIYMTEHVPHFSCVGLSKIEQQNTVDYYTLVPYGSELP